MLPLVLAAAALVGFHPGVRLAPAASFVAGKPVTVYCANSATDWDRFLDSTYGNHNEASGSTVPSADNEELAVWVCASLATALKQPRAVPTPRLAVAVLVLTHESIHSRGESDEGVTDCAASHEMPRVAVKFFHVRPGKDLRLVMAYVAAYRDGRPDEYRAVC